MRLRRIAHTAHGVFGVLLEGRVPFALTLEDPDNENRRSVSCIPLGTYVCRRVQSPKFGNTFEVTGVPGRSAILFHAGNTTDDTEGCILVGEQFTAVGDRPTLGLSREGFREFLERVKSVDQFVLEITE